jgi:hypothetical protein
MKKAFLTLGLVIATIFVITSCGDRSEATDQSTTTVTQTDGTDDYLERRRKRMAFSDYYDNTLKPQHDSLTSLGLAEKAKERHEHAMSQWFEVLNFIPSVEKLQEIAASNRAVLAEAKNEIDPPETKDSYFISPGNS